MQYKKLVIVAALLVGGSMYVYWKDSEHAELNARIARENSVTVIPDQARVAWYQSIALALSRHIIATTPYQIGVKDTALGGTAFYPRNSASFSCDPILGVSISFGFGEDAPEVDLLGPLSLDKDLQVLNFGPGVGSQSPAAKQLLEETCLFLSRKLGPL